MGYNLVKINHYFTDYLEDYYRRNPHMASEPYAVQYEQLMADAFYWADFMSRGLQKLGVNAQEIVGNAAPLQASWAREHGLSCAGAQLVLAQLEQMKPDVVFVYDTKIYNGKFIEAIRERVTSVRAVIGWCSYPYSRALLEAFRPFDLMLTCAPEYVAQFREHNLPMYYLPHAFEASLVSRLDNATAATGSDVFFSGGLINTPGYHGTRRRILSRLVDSNLSLELRAVLPRESAAKYVAKKCAYSLGKMLQTVQLGDLAGRLPGVREAITWPSPPSRPRHTRKLALASSPPLYGLAMLRALHKARIGLNIHCDIAANHATSLRLFETAGCGACLLTEHRANLSDFFEPGKEVVTYTSVEDCLEKIAWLLKHPEQRLAIAKAGQRRTLAEHNFSLRAETLHGLIMRHCLV